MSSEDFLMYSSNRSLFLNHVSKSNRKTELSKFSKRSIPLFKDKHGNTLLHRAVNDPNITVDSIKMYVQYFLNEKNSLLHTPLHCIIMSNCHKIDVIEFLIRRGANVNARDCNGSTPLHKAVQNPECTTELISLLIKNDAHICYKQNVTENPLMLAVRSHNHNLEIIEKLFYRACIDICMKHTEYHSTLRILCSDVVLIEVFLHFSTYVQFRGVNDDEYAQVEDIIEFCCPDGKCGFSSVQGKRAFNTDLATALLMFAVKYPSYNMQVIKKLLQRGASIYSENCLNSCALQIALSNPACSLELIRELLKYDSPEVKWMTTYLERCSFLHIAASNRNCPAEVMKLLLMKDKGPNLNDENIYHLTPLDCAADLTRDSNCNLQTVETLLMKGATTCTLTGMESSVLWKNIQVLGSPDANRDVLDCTKLLVKYALVEKERPVVHVYSCIIKMCERFRWRDSFGYFAELISYLNKCYTEIMNMMRTNFGPFNFFEFTIRFGCVPLFDDIGASGLFSQEVFKLLVYNQFPLYRRLLISLCDKKVFVDKVFDMFLYTADERSGKVVHLHCYCIKHLTGYLGNEDLFNLYLGFMNPSNYRPSIFAPKRFPEKLKVAECDSEDSICCCIAQEKKKRRLH